jgi:hypothetical protein
MGAISIEVTAYGKNIKEAFRNAQEEAQEEYGTDSYNGSINNCYLTKDVSSKRPTMHPTELYDYIIERVDKREVMGWCENAPKLNENKIKSQVKNFPQEGARKWVTVYQAIKPWSNEVVAEDKTQTGCIKKARAYVERHKGSLEIIITKRLESGKEKCATVSYKKAAGEKNGKYVFVGMAPC